MEIERCSTYMNRQPLHPKIHHDLRLLQNPCRVLLSLSPQIFFFSTPVTILHQLSDGHFFKWQKLLYSPNIMVRSIFPKCPSEYREVWPQVDLQVFLSQLRGACDSSIENKEKLI